MNTEEKLLEITATLKRYRELYDTGMITYTEYCLLKDTYLSSSDVQAGELKPPADSQRG